MRIIKGICTVDSNGSDFGLNDVEEVLSTLRSKGCIIDNIESEINYKGYVSYSTISFYCDQDLLAELKETGEKHINHVFCDINYLYNYESVFDAQSSDLIPQDFYDKIEVVLDSLMKAQHNVEEARKWLDNNDHSIVRPERYEDYFLEVEQKLERLRSHLI